MNKRKWRDIGYHYCIHRNSDIAKGRPSEQSGAHTRGMNKNSVGIALVGGRGGCSGDELLDHYAEAQQTTLRKLLNELNKEYPVEMVACHNEFASKACPISRYRSGINSYAQETRISDFSFLGNHKPFYVS